MDTNTEPKLKDFHDAIAKQLFGRTKTDSIDSKICVGCGKETTNFKDDISKKEYLISGLCQECQDVFFKQEEVIDLSGLQKNVIFECGPGWTQLIGDTFQEIQKVIKRDNLSDIYVDQIKEKFGELRIYLSSTTKEIDKLVELAEKKSTEICEVCGKPGKLLRKNGWYKTRCKEHSNLD